MAVGLLALGNGCARAPADSAAPLASAFGFQVFLATIALGLASLSRQPLTERLGLGPGRFSTAALVWLVIGTLALSFALDGIWDAAGFPRSPAASPFDSLAGVRGSTLLLALFSLALAPGVAEELLCRGWLQRGLLARLGPAPAIGIAALFFGALHGDPVYALFAAVLGAYLGLIAHLGGSIRASMLCHAANNAAALVVPDGAPAFPLAIFLSAAFSLGVLAWAHNATRTPPEESAR